MNALIERSNWARTRLLAATHMDDLSYHLMILEAGCNCLDETLRGVGVTVSDEAREAYREHMTKQGWWNWFELYWRGFEVRIDAEWFGPESMVPQQTAEWKRGRLHDEARTLYYTDYYHRAFDLWLKMLEDRDALSIPMPETPNEQLKPQPHVH